MIALSTTSPTATASPPSVMMLMPRPSAGKQSRPAATESGIASSVISVVRTRSSVRPSTSTTMIAASRTMRPPLLIESRMKSACR